MSRMWLRVSALLGVVLAFGAMHTDSPSEAGAAANQPLVLSGMDPSCDLNASPMTTWTLTSSSSEPLTVDSVSTSPNAYLLNQTFNPNPVPANGTSSLTTLGPGQGSVTLTMTVTYHGSDNQPMTISASVETPGCTELPCQTQPGNCFPTTTLTAPTTPVANGSSTMAQPSAVAAQPTFTG